MALEKTNENKRKLKFGMIGGGPGSFIGPIHRKAASLDGEIELVSGTFSSDPKKSFEMGSKLLLDPERVYSSYEEMVEKESKLPPEEKIDFVTIITPNYLHFPMAKKFVEAGFNIVCDKPLTCTVSEADELCQLTREKDIIFGVTYNYTGYPMVKQAKELVKKGILGDIRKVLVEYHHGWLSTLLEAQGSNQNLWKWRTDPEKAGASFAVGDIGSHAEYLSYYVTGLEMKEIYADLTTFVPGRKLDDDGSILIHYSNGAKGILTSSCIMVGERNNLSIRVYGTKASLEWRFEDPASLTLRSLDKPEQIYYVGLDYLEPLALNNKRVPGVQSVAYIESFANIYINLARTIRARKEGKKPSILNKDFPTVEDGARGVCFINKAVESSRSCKWVNIK